MRPGRGLQPGNPGKIVAGVEIAGGKVPQRRQAGDQVRKQVRERGRGHHILPRPAQRHDIARHLDRQLGIELFGRHQHQVNPLRMLGQQGKVDLAGALLLPFTVQRGHPPG